MNQEKIGKFIAKMRKEKNMTQQELANKLEVTDRAISKWENGRGMPDIAIIKPLCDALGITYNEFIHGEKSNTKENDKLLYTCISKLTLYEYQKAVTHFKSFYWKTFFRYSLVMLIFSIIICIIMHYNFLEFFIVTEIFVMLFIKIDLNNIAKRVYYKHNNGNVEKKYKYELYNDYFIRFDSGEPLKIFYNEINKSIETKDNIYLYSMKQNRIFIFQKNILDLNIINFIKNIKNNYEDNSNLLVDEKIKKNKNFYNLLLIILLIGTIIITYFAPNNYKYESYIDIISYHRMYWKFLIIPIAAITIGLKYKSLGFKAKLNIVIGIISTIFLLIGGIMYFSPIKKYDYNKIYELNSITKLELPVKGNAYYMHFDSFLNGHAKNYTITEINLKNELSSYVYEQIKNSDTWILLDSSSSDLRKYIPSTLLDGDDEIYISIYNSTNDIYNTFVDETGTYEIYFMAYNLTSNKLNINKFDYEYTKRNV